MQTYIYVIENKVNGHAYVGKSKVPNRRWKRHKEEAAKCNENSSWLYKAMSKHGIENFEFRIVDVHEDEEYALRVLEPIWIARMKGEGIHLYNMTLGGDGMPGYAHSKESRAKISKSNKGRKLTDEHKRRLSEVNKGREPSDEARRKMSEANKGKPKPPFTEAHRQKLSAVAKLRGPMNEDHKQKIAEGVKNSPHVGHPIDEETRERIAQKLRGQVQSDESKIKRGVSMRKYHEARRAAKSNLPKPPE